MQLGFYFDQTRCHGCSTCEVACKDRYDIQDETASWRRVITVERGRFPDVFVAFLPLPCLHCAEPACVAACPVNAITKRNEDGIVTVGREICLGKENCGLCLEACPYGAPQFGTDEDAKMQKCELCIDWLTQGKRPTCVDACPMHALDFGPLDALEIQYGVAKEAAGFVYSSKVKPSIIFKPKTDSARASKMP